MRVLVVDDEPLARKRLLRMLEHTPDAEPVGEASNGREALERLSALAPDVVLLDVRMESEHKAGSIKGSVNVPLFMLRLKAESLDLCSCEVSGDTRCETPFRRPATADRWPEESPW